MSEGQRRSVHTRAACAALLIDFDGVVRVYDRRVTAAIETRHGLAEGTLLDAALAWPRLLPAITGRISRAEWMAGVADALADRLGGVEAARAAVAEWDGYRGEVVPAALALVRATRAAGRPVALTTNATDDLGADLAGLGLTAEFDAVVNSAVLGVHKPTASFFMAACAAVDTPPDACLFVDDDDRNVRGARAAGLAAFRWTGGDDRRYVYAALGIDGGSR